MKTHRTSHPIAVVARPESLAAALAACAGALLLSGCSSQDFSAPVSTMTDVMETRNQSQSREAELEARRRVEQLAQMAIAWDKIRAKSDRDYIIGTDDELDIGIMALEKPGEQSTIRRTVRQDGKVTMPLVGDIEVRGSTPSELEGRLTGIYKGRYLKDPAVTVKVAEYRSQPVVVTGAVGKPGVYHLTRNHSSVLEILAQADGLTMAAGDTLIIVRGKKTPKPETPGEIPEPAAAEAPPLPPARPAAAVADVAGDASSAPAMAEVGLVPAQTQTPPAASPEADPLVADMSGTDMITVDLKRLVSEGDVRLNLTVFGHDIVSVPARKAEFVYVLGYVNNPGAMELKNNTRIDSLQAVAMAGGLAASARAENSFVITERDMTRRVVKVDLTKITRGIRPPVYLRSGDTLIVGSSPLAKLAEFIKPSIGASANLMPIP